MGKKLMGKVLGTVIEYEIVIHRIPVLWRQLGKLDIINLGKDVLLFRFERQGGIKKVLFRGLWFLFGHYLMLTKWKPNFRPLTNPFKSMPMSVRFPKLPMEYYDKSALF